MLSITVRYDFAYFTGALGQLSGVVLAHCTGVRFSLLNGNVVFCLYVCLLFQPKSRATDDKTQTPARTPTQEVGFDSIFSTTGTDDR